VHASEEPEGSRNGGHDSMSTMSIELSVYGSEERSCGGPRLSRMVRAGAAAGSYAPLPIATRREVLEPMLPDIALLQELTGESFADWKGDTGRGDFRSRQASPSGSGARN
jgi:hypothetical protein